MEPQWRRLRYQYGDQIQCHYRMVGLIPNWEHFHDAVHSVSRPAQMAPLWLQISQSTGVPLDNRLWTEDPPMSSVPACLAVKAAQRQGAWAAEAVLRRLREAAMLQRRNIARLDVLVEIVEQAANDLPPDLPFDILLWTEAMRDKATGDALRDDMQHVRYYGIDRFPAIQFQRAGERPILCVGHREFAALSEALRHIDPLVQPRRQMNLPDFTAYWGRLTHHEVAAALQVDLDACKHLVQEAAQRGELENVELLC